MFLPRSDAPPLRADFSSLEIDAERASLEKHIQETVGVSGKTKRSGGFRAFLERQLEN